MSGVEIARHHLAAGQVEQAVAELERGAARGEAASWLELGELFLIGKHVKRDLPRARDCFYRAGRAGDPAGQSLYISFMAIGLGAAADWSGAVECLREFARDDADAAQQIALIDRMSLSPSGDPVGDIRMRQLSREPHVWSIESLFSPEECAYIVARAQPLLRPSTIVDPETGRLKPHPVRTSCSAVFPWWESENLVIHVLNRRIAAASGTAVAAGEPLQVLRYQPGQQFRPHFDAFDAIDNQRILTMLVYLNDGFQGGETKFMHTGLTIAGRTGDGLLFRNALSGGARDNTAQHAGMPVVRGEKFLASRWIRERPIMPV